MRPNKKAARRPGRPSKYSAELVGQICALLRQGHFRVYVAEKLELTTETLRVWERDKPEFSAAIKKAELDRKESLLERIASASSCPAGLVDWKAAAWILERMYPKEFSLHNRIDLQAQAEVKLTNDQIRAELSELEQRERELAGKK